MKRLLNILFWSVIAAAFIGPGTVTTAARAGSDFRFALAWALLFSVFACLVLQEASGRITVLTGKELGEAIRGRFAGSGWGRSVPVLAAIGIILGCAAFEAGNLLGGVAGLRLIVDLSPAVLTSIAGGAAALLLATGNTKWIARVAGALVAVMGVAFLVTAVRLGPDIGELLRGLLVPRIPVGGTVLVLGLVGTTSSRRCGGGWPWR
jgi:NRAMP (natural resistance-associated macrophage protein)-like metal ion transporter